VATAPIASRHDRESRLAALRAALEGGTLRAAHRMVNAMHPAEVAHLLKSLPPAQREVVWGFVEPEAEGEVLIELSDEVREGLIGRMDAEELVAAAEGLEVDDLASKVEALRKAGARFRNDIVTGFGGKQILLDDPAGNPIELFEPPRK